MMTQVQTGLTRMVRATQTRYELGDRLPNKAIVISQRGNYVFAYWPIRSEFVVWYIAQPSGYTCLGHYFSADRFDQAVLRFENLSGE